MFNRPIPISAKRTKKIDALSNIRNLFQLERSTINYRIFEDIRNLHENDERNYYQPLRIKSPVSKNNTNYDRSSVGYKNCLIAQY